MVRNIFREHFDRVTAARTAGADRQDGSHDTAHEAVLRALAVHKINLRGIQSVEAKADYKRKALPDLMPWVAGVLDSGRKSEDPVVSHALVWLLDVGDFARGMDVAEYVLVHGLKMPDEYRRNPATVIADIVADTSLKQLETGKAPDVDVLQQVIEMTEGHDMPDEVRAKLHKAVGLGIMPDPLPTGFGHADAVPALFALKHLQRAFELSATIGVKKPIDRLRAYAEKYRKANPADMAEQNNTTTGASGTGAQPGTEDAGTASGSAGGGSEGTQLPPVMQPVS